MMIEAHSHSGAHVFGHRKVRTPSMERRCLIPSTHGRCAKGSQNSDSSEGAHANAIRNGRFDGKDCYFLQGRVHVRIRHCGFPGKRAGESSLSTSADHSDYKSRQVSNLRGQTGLNHRPASPL